MMSQRQRRERLALALVAAISLTGRPARAEGTADEADAHFRLATEDYQKGAYDSALTHFMQSNRLAPNVNVLFNIAGTYEAMARLPDAYRYYVDALQGEIDPRQRAVVEAAIVRITPRVAVLEAVTDPPGATIYVDRKDLGSIGKAPRALALPPGKHRVIVELEGFEPRTSDDVELTTGKRVRVSLPLVRIVGRARIALEGGVAAEVRLDGEASRACLSPCELPLKPGRHELSLRAPGFEEATRVVVIEAGKTAVVAGKLVRLVGAASIHTEERDAAVFLDGKSMGFAPVVLRAIPTGKHAVRVELRDFKPFSTTIEVRADEQTDLGNILLEPLREVRAVSRTAESLDDAPSSVTVIDRAEISAFGYPTIYEAIRGVRGIALTNDRAFSTASVRGIGQPGDYGNRFLVLSNGQPLNENLGAASFIAQEGRADLGDVERIEVVRGPGSLLYGTGAVSGVLNLVLRPPDAPDEAHANVGVYDNHVAHARAGFHHNFGPGRSVWASVSGARSDGFNLAIPVVGAPESGLPVAHRVEAFGTVGTAGLVTVGALSAQWFYHQRNQNVPVGAYGIPLDHSTVLHEQRFMAEVRYEPHLSDTVQILARGHGNYFGEPIEYFVDNGTYRSDFTGAWFGAEARVVYTPRPWLRLTAGAEAQYHPEATLIAGSDLDGEKIEYLNEKRPYAFGAGYVVADGSPAPWLRFSAGLRADVYSTFGAVIVPRAALIFKPANGHTIKVMGGRAFRAPSVYEQYYNDGGLTETVAEDPARGLSLSPESSISGEVEYSVRFRRDWVALAGVHLTSLERRIDLVPDAAGSEVVRYANSAAAALVAGGDLELRREWRRGIMLAASYGYQRAQLVGTGAANPLLENAPRHLASARFVLPVFKEIVSFGFRGTLEAPRRIRADSDEETKTALVADAVVSGLVREVGLRYVLGVYNFTDWHYDLPVDPTFASRTIPQNGLRFLLDLQWTLQ
jgi:outer membrane receptor protein involved in Fe transport